MKRPTPRSLHFRLAIDAEQYLEWYKGSARDIVVQSEEGLTVRFPAGAVQGFLAHDGIHGRFVIRFDEQHKLLDLERLSP